MRAALLVRHGQPPAYADHPDPARRPGQTLVMVTAAPIVPLDLLCATGTSYFGPPALPYVPGVQGVGQVLHSDVFAAGTRVFVSTSAGMSAGDGSAAQRCVVADADVIEIRAELPDAAVAAIGLSGVAAWMALTWRGRLEAGETVLILGAGGAVGQAAIGAAQALGAARVVAVCRSESAARRAESAGAAEILISSAGTAADLLAALRTACPEGVDLVLDPVFGPPASAAALLLRAGGRLVNLGSAAGATAQFDSAVLRSRSAAVLGYTNNSLTAEQRSGALTAVLSLAAEGRLSVDHQVLPLADCATGWRRTAAGGGARVVLLP